MTQSHGTLSSRERRYLLLRSVRRAIMRMEYSPLKQERMEQINAQINKAASKLPDEVVRRILKNDRHTVPISH